MRLIDIPPLDVPRHKAIAEQERQAAEAELLNFDLARLEALNSLAAWVDLFGAERVRAMLEFTITERSRA